MKAKSALCLLFSLSSFISFAAAPIFQNIDKYPQILETRPLAEDNHHLHLSNVNTFTENVIDIVKKFLANSKIEILIQNLPDREGRIIRFALGGIPICGYEAKAFIVQGQLKVLGYIPTLQSVDEVSSHDSLQDVLEFVESDLETSENKNIKVLSASPCIYINQARAIPIWKMKLNIGTKPWEVWADREEVYLRTPLSFDLQPVTGEMLAYKEYPKKSPLIIFKEPVTGDGTLTNDYFVTDTTLDPTQSVPRAVSSDSKFVYDATDPRFPEVSAFVYAMQAKIYFEKLGYAWGRQTPLILSLHNEFEGSRNNASYFPSGVSPYNRPAILFGDGDGVNFGSFATDNDVITHEFSHHVIYGSLSSSTQEGAVLHEGLADYFAEARSGSPCFAQSVCISESVCFNGCLRTALNSVMYDDSFYQEAEVHLKSLAMSGMLWKLRESLKSDLDSVVLKALSFLVPLSGFRHLFISLLLADQQLFSGVHACEIYDAASKRNFHSLIADINCADFGTITNKNPREVASTKEPTPKKKNINCGSVGISMKGKTWTPLFFLLPLFLVLNPFSQLIVFFRRRRSGA